MKKAMLVTSTLACLLLCGPALATDLGDEDSGEGGGTGALSSEELMITLQVPLLSPLFAETPVASVDDEPITARELTGHLASAHEGRADAETSAEKDYESLLERIIATRLIVLEARNIGLDETDAIVSQIDSFSKQLLISSLISAELATVAPDEEEVDDLYRKMAREFLLTTIKFRTEKDALSFQEQHESGADFHELAGRFVGEGRAQGEIPGEQYMKLKDLLPQIAMAAFDMHIGSTSQIFQSSGGFLMFHVDDIRTYEDDALREEARQKTVMPLRQQKAKEYADFLEQKYVILDEEVLEDMSFEGERVGVLWFRKQQPFDYQTLLDDERVIAKIRGDDAFTVSVADVARALKKKYFHGVDRATGKEGELNQKKTIILKNILFEKTATMEAVARGMNETEEYTDAVEKYENSLLFGEFINKVIAPDVSISEEEARQYYQEHIDDFSTPPMYRMNGLAFSALSDAEDALGKLRKGADFNWVSANSPGQVDKDTKGVLSFDGALLSSTALPKGLSKIADGARQGDSLLYSSPNDYHYVISIAKVFPPEPQDFETARETIGRSISDQKVKALVDDWVGKLREAYETRIFITGLDE